MKIKLNIFLTIVLTLSAFFLFGCSKNEEGMVTTKSGLKYKDIVVGTGTEAVKGKNVWAHYIGTFEDGKKFDDSHERNAPIGWQLGTGGIGQVIPGFDEGVIGMKVGGKRKLIIPPKLAFGEVGLPEDPKSNTYIIPPNTTLVYIVELLDVKDLQ